MGDAVAASADELAQKLAAVGAEVEAMATSHHLVAGVSAASTAFRVALQEAEAAG